MKSKAIVDGARTDSLKDPLLDSDPALAAVYLMREMRAIAMETLEHSRNCREEIKQVRATQEADREALAATKAAVKRGVMQIIKGFFGE